jgi:hypothetical protein
MANLMKLVLAPLMLLKIILCVAIIGTAALWVVGCGGGESEATPSTASGVTTAPAKPTPAPTPTRYGQLFMKGMTPQKAALPICRRYERVLAIAAGPARSYLRDSSHAVKDSYAADAYGGSYQGISIRTLEGRIYTVALARLKKVTRPKLTRQMTEKFVEDSLYVCRLSRRVAETEEVLRLASDRETRVRDMAADAPWYPKGWFEWDDGSVAYKWTNGACDTYGGACWTMRVISHNGCPDGLYAEINIEDASGTVIDYSNDTLGSLSSGQQAALEFVTYEGAAHSARLTDVSCY